MQRGELKAIFITLLLSIAKSTPFLFSSRGFVKARSKIMQVYVFEYAAIRTTKPRRNE
jgi:hypothetical protein